MNAYGEINMDVQQQIMSISIESLRHKKISKQFADKKEETEAFTKSKIKEKKLIFRNKLCAYILPR